MIGYPVGSGRVLLDGRRRVVQLKVATSGCRLHLSGLVANVIASAAAQRLRQGDRHPGRNRRGCSGWSGCLGVAVEHGNRVGEGLLEQRDLSDPPRRPDLPMTDRNLMISI